MSRDKMNLTETMAYDAKELKKERIKDILHQVDDALKERGSICESNIRIFNHK